jgi:hypothetical protein
MLTASWGSPARSTFIHPGLRAAFPSPRYGAGLLQNKEDLWSTTGQGRSENLDSASET